MDNNKVKEFFKRNVGYFIVAFVCIVYIATGLLTIQETGKTILQIIADSVIILSLGVFINRVFDLQGMLNGDREQDVIDTIKKHSDMVIDISSDIDRLDDWCKIKNDNALRLTRIKILAPSGLKYEDCFDEAGVGIGYKPTKDLKELRKSDKVEYKKEKLKIKLYDKALRAKITNLNSNILTSEGGKEGDPNYLGRSKRQYETRSTLWDTFSRVGIALIFGYYGVGLAENFSYVNLIWQLFQVSLFLVMGVVKLYQSFMFVKDEFKGRIQKKTNILQEFLNYIKQNPTPTILEEKVSNKTPEQIPEQENLNKGDLENGSVK